MASTPPPLPSSSEDSDFDDDDFGCFNSAPVKAPSNAFQHTEKETQNTTDESECSVAESADASSLNARVETFDKSDNAVSNNSDSVNMKEEKPTTDLFSSDQFHDSVISEPQIISNEHHLTGDENDSNSNVSEASQGFVESNEGNMIDQALDNNPSHENFAEENGTQDRSETVEHSTIEKDERSIELSDEEDLPITDNLKCPNNISSDSDTNLDSAQNVVDSQDVANTNCEKDEFGDWSDMQTFQAGAIEFVKNTDEAENESPNNEDNDGSGIEGQQISTAAGEDVNEIRCSPQNDSPSVPLEMCKAPNEENYSQHSTLIDDHDDCKGDDDDDFGDFADFSSHKEKENEDNKETNLPPLSFRTSISEDVEEEKIIENVGNVDVIEDVEKDDSFMESVDSKDTGDDDFDDDWGFKSADTNGNDNGSEDFGNFGSADTGNNDGDWASFNEPTIAANGDDDDDDFNDFSENDFQTPSFVQSESISPKVEELSSKVEKIVCMCFPETSEVNQNVSFLNQEDCDNDKTNVEVAEIDNLCSVVEMGLKVTLKAKEETWTIVKELRDKDPMVGTWGRLKDVNSSHALDYGWNSSHCCQEIFSTLHIDTKNMLFSQKKQAVPFYASGLGILEPIRGGPNPAEKSQAPVAPTPALLDTSTSKPEEQKKSLDIPPVDFDWGSSGLTNPLKVFKNDSFNNGLSTLEPFSDVLHKNIEPTKELSSEAKSILSKIPNLNFMRSNVLMFPIKD